MATGRPPKFASVEELQAKVDAFFQHCDDNKQPYTMTGLALALDTTRETLRDYAAKNGYSDTIKKARQRVEEYAERRLYAGGSPVGVIFNLKNNFGWKDKQEIDINDISERSDDELISRLKALGFNPGSEGDDE